MGLKVVEGAFDEPRQKRRLRNGTKLQARCIKTLQASSTGIGELSAAGKLLWRQKINDVLLCYAVGPDGTIYADYYRSIVAYNANGQAKWCIR